ncbi:MAG TPA: ATP-binding protein [Caulobacterales bacterium]|nr:ATP-binding protein [Caulobacterales bacterium]
MRLLGSSGGAAIALFACVVFAVGPANAQQNSTWVSQAEALARRIEAQSLVVTNRVRQDHEREAFRAQGRQRLQMLFDTAAEDYVASSADRVAHSRPLLEREAAAQHDARYQQMAQVLVAYAPALDGDYVAARRNLETLLLNAHDPYVIAAAERFRSYALTDLGLVGNALEAARSGLAGLPDEPLAATLRSGLQDALAYVSMRIGDFESGFEHMQRSVEMDAEAGKPIDGLTVVYNIASMLADNQQTDMALRIAAIEDELSTRSDDPDARFYARLLCAKVRLAASDYAGSARCADEGRAMPGAPPEYVTRMLVIRARALARLGEGHAARRAIDELKQIAASRGDPALQDRIRSIEPEVLQAEGRIREAYAALISFHEESERNVLRRFNAGVKELRATMENEITRADERAQQQAIRSELQQRAMQGMALAVILAVACLIAAIAIAVLIYRSRRAMLVAVGRAEEILARRGAKVDAVADAMPTKRLRNILDEIERRDDELKQAFEALDAARLAAESANIAKSQFLATMSHELRTPLNAIIGYSELVMEEAEDAGVGHLNTDLTRIRGAGQRLLLLINDLLDLAKIEAGRMVAEPQPFEVGAVVDDMMKITAPMAEANGNRLVLDQPKPLGEARTDDLKLSQCLLNLLSNASKFTKNGQISLRARREAVDGADWLVFEVADTGIGIAKEAQERLFKPFVQADASTTRAFGGTGLGLAITRRLAQLLGGDVTLDSEVGRGSTFTVRVPAILPGDATAPANDDDPVLVVAA